MGFKETVNADNSAVFMNTGEFGEIRDVTYNGVTYPDVSLLLTEIGEQDIGANNSSQNRNRYDGLFSVKTVMRCVIDDIGGRLPEKGMKISVKDGGFIQDYYIMQSYDEIGICRLDLKAVDE